MAKDEDKLYRVSGATSQTMDEIREQLIKQEKLGTDSSNKELLDYIVEDFASRLNKKEDHVSDSDTKNVAKNNNAILVNEKAATEILGTLTDCSEQLHELHSLLAEFTDAYFQRGIFAFGDEKPGTFYVESQGKKKSFDEAEEDSETEALESDDEEMPSAKEPYEKWIPEFTPEEISFLQTMESDDFDEGFFIQRDEKGRLRLPKGHFYDSNDFPHDRLGLPYWRTPFGYYPQNEIERSHHLTHPSEYPHRFFKYRIEKLQKWYGRDRHDGWINDVDPDYDYYKDPVNFVVKDFVRFYKEKKINFWTDRKENTEYEQIG